MARHASTTKRGRMATHTSVSAGLSTHATTTTILSTASAVPTVSSTTLSHATTASILPAALSTTPNDASRQCQCERAAQRSQLSGPHDLLPLHWLVARLLLGLSRLQPLSYAGLATCWSDDVQSPSSSVDIAKELRRKLCNNHPTIQTMEAGHNNHNNQIPSIHRNSHHGNHNHRLQIPTIHLLP